MGIKPIGDRVLVEPVTAEEVTKSGIVLPDTIDKEKKAEGKILFIGNGEKVTKLGLSVGQKIIFGQYAGDDVKVDNKEFKIINHEDILAVID
ncbi:co-chaperone GroES [Candidatus Falkowbacteria bacterium]|uniref:Co-chaperonin GroES n=1 Tax=Candidatus Buchananbacteria bacterium CG10_big_fil_rev_8_21_14_0_10_33_19 TaxID=1974525 RepID=A0A2H0W4Y9_9BACT|nr:co-chaperone GroES [Candidatus Falkowbacteria bacterium]PIS06415.1 MAG: co-chaperone GroES [Candidatus Buchananbacteria bacterium CG10_big_fil_rev_8_21_14_0_10_33_19]